MVRLQACLTDIKTWKTQNCLLLNSDKTEVVLFGPERFREKLSTYIVTLDGISLASSSTVRNLGVIFDQNLSFHAHIKLVSRTAFFHLRNIAKIRNILSQGDAEKLVHAFVTSRLDYCNSYFFIGLSHIFSEKPPADPKCCSQSSDENKQERSCFSSFSFSSLAPC